MYRELEEGELCITPFFDKHDTEMFYEELNKCTTYFEFGSGGSTYQASIRPNIKKIYTVESDLKWLEKIKTEIGESPKITYIYHEMKTRPATWGRPGWNASNRQKMGYSDKIRMLPTAEAKNIDLLLIDGRFRVACCLKSFDMLSDNCIIAFDDFLNRQHKYKEVLKYFKIIKTTRDNKMALMKKKKDVKNPPSENIKKYELIFS